MEDDEGVPHGQPEAMALTSVTRDDLNTSMAALKTSLMNEVKTMLKLLIEGIKGSPEPALVVKPANIDSDANSSKQAAKGMRPSSPLENDGTGTYASVPPPMVYGGPVPTPRLNPVGPPPKLVKGDFANWVFSIKSHFESQLNKLVENHRARILSP